MKKIIVVEDDTAICNELLILLNNSGYEAMEITDWDHVKDEIIKSEADLVLLDINIPKMNGEVVLKELRKVSDIPVIMVTSKTSEIDEVLSMSYGADDYITKPYNPTILLLRISAVLKRMSNNTGFLMYKDVSVHPAKGMLKKAEKEITLTKNEMIIFMQLLERYNMIVTRDELMTALWDNEEYINDNALTVNISRLRSKLTELGYDDAIETRKRQGYILI